MSVSEPARELPADSPDIPEAVAAAQRGEITHLTVDGERAAVIVPEFVLRAIRAYVRQAEQDEDAEDAAEADASWDEPGEDTPWEQVKAELGI
jgi:hypothetical protein